MILAAVSILTSNIHPHLSVEITLMNHCLRSAYKASNLTREAKLSCLHHNHDILIRNNSLTKYCHTKINLLYTAYHPSLYRSNVIQQPILRKEICSKTNQNYPTIPLHLKTLSRNQPYHPKKTCSYSHAHSHSIKIQQQPFQIFASTLPGLEQILSHELETKIDISRNNQSITKGGIQFCITSVQQLYQCHLQLGTVSHLFLRLPVAENAIESEGLDSNAKSNFTTSSNTTFYAIHAKQLFQKVRKMSIWKALIPISRSTETRTTSQKRQLILPKFDIRVTSIKSKLYHTKLIANCVEKAIYKALELDDDFYNKISPNENDSFITNNDSDHKSDCYDHNIIRILVRIDQNEVQLSIDTSLSPLHKRGYKLDVRKAPLREDIAYAFLYSSGWSHCIINDYLPSESRCLIDPFCGSGTILIEGANIALGLPPGRLRPTPCQYTSLCNEELWKKMTESCTNNVQLHVKTDIPLVIGSDRDEGAVKSTLANAKRAGVENFIQLHVCSLTSNPWFINNSLKQNYSDVLFATNPPFGLRISPTSSKKKRKMIGNTKKDVVNSLLPLYQSLGNIVRWLQKNQDNESGVGSEKSFVHMGILSHDMDLARQTGVSNLKKKFTTRLGGISVSALGTYNENK